MKQYDTSTDTVIVDNKQQPSPDTASENAAPSTPAGWNAWLAALRKVLPIYLAIHLAFLVLTYCSALFSIQDFSTQSLHLSTMLMAWYRWDSGHFAFIAAHGYDIIWRTAFFPFYPILEHVVGFLTGDVFVAGLLISNLTGLAMLVVLYRLVEEDFSHEYAWRTVLYLSVFPTAFFFAAAYSESLFLLLILLSFYCMRRGRWWLAGLCALLSALTRSAAICLVLPFCYEYLRQHDFSLRKVRLDALACLGVPAGIGAFALYCLYRFHNLLAFTRAQATWGHTLQGPWQGLFDSTLVILQSPILNFYAIHNVIDLSASLFILVLVILAFVGPWKFPRTYLVYTLFAALVYLYSVIFPINGNLPLASFSRYMLVVFPAFIVLAALGKNRSVSIYYLSLSSAVLAFLLLQFLTGHWVI